MFSHKEVAPTPHTIMTLYARPRQTGLPVVNTFLAQALNQNKSALYINGYTTTYAPNADRHPLVERIAADTWPQCEKVAAHRLRQDVTDKHLACDLDTLLSLPDASIQGLYRLLSKAITVRSTILLFTATEDQRLCDTYAHLSDTIGEVMQEDAYRFARVESATQEFGDWYPCEVRQGRCCLI